MLLGICQKSTRFVLLWVAQEVGGGLNLSVATCYHCGSFSCFARTGVTQTQPSTVASIACSTYQAALRTVFYPTMARKEDQRAFFLETAKLVNEGKEVVDVFTDLRRCEDHRKHAGANCFDPWAAEMQQQQKQKQTETGKEPETTTGVNNSNSSSRSASAVDPVVAAATAAAAEVTTTNTSGTSE